MATSTASVSVEEYLRTTYRPDMDYVDGELVERHVGEHWHSRLQALVTGVFLPRERERKFRVLTEQRLLVWGRSIAIASPISASWRYPTALSPC